MIIHDGRGIAISASPVSLQNAANHLNWLAKGSNNGGNFYLVRNPYPLLKPFQHMVNRTL